MPTHTIALLIEPGSTLSSVMTSLDMMSIARRYPQAKGCRVDVLSSTGGPVALAHGVQVQTQALPDTLADYATIILPGFLAEDLPTLTQQLHSVWQPVLQRLPTVRPDALLAASCYGTFVLAESGLLDGCAATTTWWLQAAFAAAYPRVKLDADRALVDGGRVLTAGAMTAHTDLSLHVLRRLFGSELARSVGGIMLVDGARTSQRPFMALPRYFADPLAQQAADWLAQRYRQPCTCEELAASLHVSYRTLHRRFQAAVGMAPLAYLQALRVEQAKVLLEDSRMSLAQIVDSVGYSDESAFRQLFTRTAGLSPAQYRERFRHPAVSSLSE